MRPSDSIAVVILLLVGLSLAPKFPGNAQAPDGSSLYVSPTGSDSNPGTYAAPFRTIMYAVQMARPGTSILLRAGTYNEEVIFYHGGTAGNPITLQNYPGEAAIIDGSMDVTGWTRIAGTNVWQASFTHKQSISVPGYVEDVISVSTAPDGYNYSGSPRAYLYVDDTPDQAHWLQPINILGSPPQSTIANLPAGSFATDVLPPPGGGPFAGKANKIYVHLADNGDPNNHRIRIPAYRAGIRILGDAGIQVSYVNIKGIAIRLAEVGISIGSNYPDVSSYISLQGLDISLNDQRGIETGFCSHHITIQYNYIHHTQEEHIHLESDNSLVDSNLIENTIAPWSVYGDMGINVLGNDNIISHNRVQSIHATTNGHGGNGVYMEEWYNGFGDVGCHGETNQNNLVQRNQIYNNDWNGIYNSGGDGNTLQNNLVYGNGGSGVVLRQGGTDSGPTGTQRNADNNNVYYNTLYSNQTYGISLDISVNNTVIRDNIIYNNIAADLDLSRGVNTTFDHNLMIDPHFVNALNGDFNLSQDSPARGAGIDVGVNQDFDGMPRPNGASYDIGALQYWAKKSRLFFPFIINLQLLTSSLSWSRIAGVIQFEMN